MRWSEGKGGRAKGAEAKREGGTATHAWGGIPKDGGQALEEAVQREQCGHAGPRSGQTGQRAKHVAYNGRLPARADPGPVRPERRS